MNATVLFGGLAFLALFGWALTLVAFSRSLLPMANALAVLHKVDKAIDDRIAAVVERIRARQERGQPRQPARPPEEPRTDAMRSIFGGVPILPVDEQPDADESLEVMS